MKLKPKVSLVYCLSFLRPSHIDRLGNWFPIELVIQKEWEECCNYMKSNLLQYLGYLMVFLPKPIQCFHSMKHIHSQQSQHQHLRCFASFCFERKWKKSILKKIVDRNFHQWIYLFVVERRDHLIEWWCLKFCFWRNRSICLKRGCKKCWINLDQLEQWCFHFHNWCNLGHCNNKVYSNLFGWIQFEWMK